MLKIFCLIFLTSQLVSVALAGNALLLGQGLNKGEQIVSNSGVYRFIMQNDGNLVIYNGDFPIWATMTVGRGRNFLMQRDGNGILFGNDGRVLFFTGTRNLGARFIIMQNDGNLVVFDGQNNVLWASGTQGQDLLISKNSQYFSSETGEYNSPPDEINPAETPIESSHHDKDKLFSGEHLKKGEMLESDNGKFALALEEDGFLELIDKEMKKTLWKVGAGRGNKLMLKKDGNAVLVDAKMNILWQSNTMNTQDSEIAALWLKDDGNLVIVDKMDSVKWESRTAKPKSGRTYPWEMTSTTPAPMTSPQQAESKATEWFNKNWEEGNIAIVLPLAIDGLDEAIKKLVLAHVKSNDKLGDAYSQKKFVYNRSWDDLIKRIAGNVKPDLSWD